jgi:ligand-binding sensor domain-containing protein
MTTCQTFILLFRQSIAIVALLWSLQLPAQTPRLKFKHISTEQGLSNTTVEAIVQDKRGFIWIGTRDGLNRYDGGQLVIYRFSATDSNSISDNYVTYIYEDS